MDEEVTARYSKAGLLFQHLTMTKENHKILNQGRQFLGLESKSGLTEYDAALLTTRKPSSALLKKLKRTICEYSTL
jgi:hypothetical protein